ncbi:hypothetical protein F8S13_24975 [Chloroflexia bacterium SDU3-3]|nr:hypothetical protein F8S13_24975 [Chloroflexia bacterium SDU3-3]
MENPRFSPPFWLIGVLVAIALVLIGQYVGGAVNNQALVDTFRPQPTDPSAPPAAGSLPQVSLPQLPPDAQAALKSLGDRFASGAAVPALTPVASGARARVEVSALARDGGNVKVRGTITNTAAQPLDVPTTAFTFRDSAGVTYTIGGGGATSIQPQQSAPFDLSVPLPAGRGLAMIVTLPPDEPIQQTLVVETLDAP